MESLDCKFSFALHYLPFFRRSLSLSFVLIPQNRCSGRIAAVCVLLSCKLQFVIKLRPCKVSIVMSEHSCQFLFTLLGQRRRRWMSKRRRLRKNCGCCDEVLQVHCKHFEVGCPSLCIYVMHPLYVYNVGKDFAVECSANI